MDFVNEQHVPVTETGQNGCEVAWPFNGRPACHMELNTHFGGNDAGKGGFPKTWRPGKQQVVGGLVPTAGGFQNDAEMFFEFALPDELLKCPGAQPGGFVCGACGVHQGFVGKGPWVKQFVTHLDRRQFLQRQPQQVFRTVTGLPGQVPHGGCDLVGTVPEAQQGVTDIAAHRQPAGSPTAGTA